MIGHRTYRFSRWTTGLSNSQNLKNLYSVSFGYTDYHKKVSGASATAVLAATATATTSQTVTSGITQPDVPRALSVTPGGTTSQLLDSAVVITGTNVEGKVITESFQLVPSSGAVINGTKAFKTVTSVFIPSQGGAAATVAVGTRNALGVFHRLYNNNTTVKVVQATSISATPALQAAPTVVEDEEHIEDNLVTPATNPDGTTMLVIAYSFDQWSIAPINDDPAYSTSTSTSTSSTSTSTTTAPTTSTSTSSTSTSSTSSSISTSSTSTSSTSTSTTTVP